MKSCSYDEKKKTLFATYDYTNSNWYSETLEKDSLDKEILLNMQSTKNILYIIYCNVHH